MTAKPSVITLDDRPRQSGRKVTWDIKNGEDAIADGIFRDQPMVSVSGNFKSVAFMTAIADEPEQPFSIDGAKPFLITKPCVMRLPAHIGKLRPVVSGGSAIVVTFISEMR